MKNTLFVCFALVLFITLSFQASAQFPLTNSERHYSATYLVSGGEEIAVDISSLSQLEKENLMHSLTQLYNAREILNVRETSNKTFILKFSDNGQKKITINENGIFIKELTDSFIVEFKSPSLAEKKVALEKEIGSLRKVGKASSAEKKERSKAAAIASYKSQLESEHEKAINDIKNRIGRGATGNVIRDFGKIIGNAILKITGREVGDEMSELKIDNEYYKTFNGISLKLDEKQAEEVKKSEYVKRIYPDAKVKINLLDSAPLIGADDAWASLDGAEDNITGKGVRVAVIDTGVDYAHSDFGSCTKENFLAGECEKVAGGYDFVNFDDNPMDDHGHGTHVASTIAGNGEISGNIISEPVRNANLFSFKEWDSYVETRVFLRGGKTANFGILFGNENGFSGAGRYIWYRMASSDSNILVFNTTQDYYFAVSANDSSKSESRILWPEVKQTGYGYEIKLSDHGYSENLCTILYNGKDKSVCKIGNIGLKVKKLVRFGKSGSFNYVLTFEAVNNESFNRIYDANGNYIFVPLEREFPVNNYTIKVFDRENNVIEEKTFQSGNENGGGGNNGGNIIGNVVINEEGAGEDKGGNSGGAGFSSGISSEAKKIRGIAPDAKIYAYKVLNSKGSGSWSNIIAAIERAVDPNEDGDSSDHLDIISMSLGGWGNPDDAISKAVDNAAEFGVVSVIAAGNSGPDLGTIGSPGTARKAITVGATYKKDYDGFWMDCEPGSQASCGFCDSTGKVFCNYWGDKNPRVDEITSFSSRGPVFWDNGFITKPDVVAPGALICAARYDSIFAEGKHPYYKLCLDEEHVQMAGTSMATPIVSGVAALVKQAHPDFTPEEIKSAIKLTARNLGKNISEQGSGRVDSMEAINAKFVVLGDLDFGKIPIGNSIATKKITIKNIGNELISLTMRAENADELISNAKVRAIRISGSKIELAPNERKEISVNVTLSPASEGLFIGKIILNDGKRNYLLPYSFTKLSELKLTLEGGNYPNRFIAHTNDFGYMSFVYQGEDFEGNSATLNVKSGDYNVYAINPFLYSGNPFYDDKEYFVIDKVKVPKNAKVGKTLKLSDAKKFIVKARDKEDSGLKIYEWYKGLQIYESKKDLCYNYQKESECKANKCSWDKERTYNRCYSNSYDMGFYDSRESLGDRIVYVSPKPNNNLHIDIVFRYTGVKNA